MSGFTAENRVYPDDGIAIVVLTNDDTTNVSEAIADELSKLLLVTSSPDDSAAVVEAKRLFLGRTRADRLRAASLIAHRWRFGLSVADRPKRLYMGSERFPHSGRSHQSGDGRQRFVAKGGERR